MAKDPVCGMDVEESSAAAKHVYKGQTYFFCSHHCLAKFKEDPEKFLKALKINRVGLDRCAKILVLWGL
jgi:YHS domain-containing protein